MNSTAAPRNESKFSNDEIEKRYGFFSDNRETCGWQESDMVKSRRATITELAEKYIPNKADRNKLFDAIADIESESEFEGFVAGFRDVTNNL